MNMIDKLKEHLKNTTIKELKEEWKAVEKYNNVGPTVINFLQKKEEVYKGDYKGE